MRMVFVRRPRWFLFLVLLLVILISEAYSRTIQPSLPIDAHSAILMDALTGQILFQRNPQAKMAPASFAKLLELYVAFDELHAGRLKTDDLMTVSRKAWQTGGSRMFLKAGERVRVEDLLKGIAVVAGNDASVALAEHLSGSEDAFVERMNEKAKLVGMKDSQFKNAHGMPARDQFTTALDMAILARRYIEDHPEALALHSTLEFQYRDIRQPNRNTLLRNGMGVDGLTTGYVEKAGYHLLATAKRNGQRMIAVVMGSQTMQGRLKGAEVLLEYGFKNFSTLEAVKKGMSFGPGKVIRGRQTQVGVLAAEDGRVTVAKGNEKSVTLTPEMPEVLVAPIQKGQVVGKVVIGSGEERLKEVNLVAAAEVPKGIHVLWLFLSGGILGLTLIGLIGWWRMRRQKRRFRG
jgi:D-alanyl-D-alanine carboxypeptidase (penicillin-binding protein 5/6)